MRLFMLVKLALYETLSLHYVVNLLLSSLTTAIPDLFSKRLYALARPAQPRDFRLQNWAKLSQIQNFKTLKSLKSQGGRFSFMAIQNLQDVPFHPVVVIGLGYDLLFISLLGHCDSRPPDLKSSSNVSLPFAWITGPRKRTQLVCSFLQILI